MDYLPSISKSPWLTYKEFVKTADNPKGIVPKGTFDSLKHRGSIRVSGVGGNGRQIYIEFDSLPTRPLNYKKMVVDEYGDPRQYIAIQPLKDLMRVDDMARRWYSEYMLPCNRHIPMDYQMKYARSCDWLNLIDICLKDKRYLKDKMQISITQFWENVALLIRKDEEVHDLPGSVDRLRRIYNRYSGTSGSSFGPAQDDKLSGYAALVDVHRWGNDFARKVSPKIENLIVSLYCMPHKPYMAEVCKMYKEFMSGKLQVVDVCDEGGGEVFEPKDFYISVKSKVKSDPDSYRDQKVKMVPYVFGESTVAYYLKQPANVAVINKMRMKGQDYDTKHRPSVKRIAPFYAFSKVTMDDIDLPFKGPDGDRVVKSYQIYDVASEAVIGVSFSEDKNKELIMEALRDMFRLIIRKGWGVPWEIEMERHLTSAMKGRSAKAHDDIPEGEWINDIFTPGVVFPATRICQRAQEKRAEGFIRKKKYGFQKKLPGFQGRFYSKLLTNRLNTDQKQLRFLFEEIVAKELQCIASYNNELHPKQDLYPGLTRWQVLECNQNPNLARYSAPQVIQFIGFSTATSIKAGVARVQYGDYVLPDIELIKNTHYNGEITAYYMPDAEGIVNEVYLFEDGQYLCEAKRRAGFQEAVIEQTADDVEIMQQQWGQQSKFDKMVKEGNKKIRKVGIVAPPGLPQGEVVAAPPGLPRGEVVGLTPNKAVKREPESVLPDTTLSARERALRDI